MTTKTTETLNTLCSLQNSIENPQNLDDFIGFINAESKYYSLSDVEKI